MSAPFILRAKGFADRVVRGPVTQVPARCVWMDAV